VPLPEIEAVNYQSDFSISDTSVKGFMFSPVSCLFALCLSDCKQGYSKTTDQIFDIL